MDAPYIVGIDLGTTNSVLASLDRDRDEDDMHIEVQSIPQLINPGVTKCAIATKKLRADSIVASPMLGAETKT